MSSVNVASPFRRKMRILGKHERYYATEVKNKREQAHLEAELAKLENEKRRDLQALKIERQKFRSKYSKLANEESDESIYEMHRSRYRKLGKEKDFLGTETITTSLHFEHIRSLIFTDGEVDLEKVLCLHLLCVHKTETLTPPKKKVKYLCKAHSPLERLIERSKKGFTNFERLSKLLPLYSIELIERGPMGEKLNSLINDGRLASRILVNEKLMALINTVVTALEQSNLYKFKQLLALGNSPAQMRTALGNKDIAEFLDSLMEHQLINNCEFFVLTPPFKIKVLDFEVKTNHGNLEHLVSHLRQNVLQQPIRSSEEDLKEEKGETRTNTTTASAINLPRPRMERRASNSSRLENLSSGPSKISARMELKKEAIRRALEEDRRLGRHRQVNYIAKNKAAAALTKKIKYDVEEEDWDVYKARKSSASSGASGRIKSLDPVSPSKYLPIPTLVENESVEETFISSVEDENSNDRESDSGPSSEEKPNRGKRSSSDRYESKYNIKQTTCPACMEKWKTPLPSPKTPKVRKSDVLPEGYCDILKTNSHHRISMMINKAMYKLQSYDRRYSTENENIRRVPPRRKESEEETMEDVYLNPMDLAKIEQEIKERETKKKVEKFLSEKF